MDDNGWCWWMMMVMMDHDNNDDGVILEKMVHFYIHVALYEAEWDMLLHTLG